MKSTRIVCFPRVLAFACCLFLLVTGCWAQQISGSISGTVKDIQGAVIPGAQITLTDQDKATQRKVNSNAEGFFQFDLLSPSTYLISVEAQGFKKWEKKDIKLYASDRIGVSDIVMQVGQVTDTVTVEANTAQLQTESAKIEGTVTSQQMTEIAVRDRNFMQMLRTIPGVSPDSLGNNPRSVVINGGRNDQVSFKLDGLVNNDYGDNGCCSVYSSLDSIAEMKVVTNGATADMGTLGASQVIVVTKSGSKEFHGNAFYLKRAEWLNANSWSNNSQLPNPTPKGRDRQNQVGFTIGGPLFIPKVFNTGKDKLFFFVTEELWRNQSPNNTRTWVPTQWERIGDFSHNSIYSDGSEMKPKDPLNGGVAFPDKIIPTNRLNSDGVALLGKFPLPTNERQLYNNSPFNYFRSNSPTYSDRLSQSYRLDYNVNEKWRIYGRYTHDYTEGGRPAGGGFLGEAMSSFELDSTGKTMGWGLQYRPSYSGMINVTTIISPTSTNELVLGTTRTQDHHYLDKVTYLRSTLGLKFQLPYPEAVQGDYGPIVAFGGSNMTVNPNFGSALPYMAFSPDYNITDNFTKIMTRHTLKAGIFFDFNRKDQDKWSGANYPGRLSITRDTNNPLDTDNQYANLLTGTFTQFQQAKQRYEGRYIWKQFEWYVSDTWKPTPGLTIDMGMRFYVMQPQYDTKGQIAIFSPGLWDASKTVRIYDKGMLNGKSVTIDPAFPNVAVPNYKYQNIVPDSGDVNNGFALAGTRGIPRGMLEYQGILAAPRLGVTWQPKFLPKTVISASGGVFYDRVQGNVISNSLQMPPTVRDSTMYYGQITDITGAAANLISVVGPTGGYVGSGKIPTTVNWNFSVQRELPRAITFQAAYTGSISRHMINGQPYNTPAFGSAWLPQNQDPTKTPTYDGKSTKPINFFRPFLGYGQITAYESSGSSNYNSLQVQINKRMSRKISFGVAYTYSKTMSYGNSIYSSLDPFDHSYNYGRSGDDRTHILYTNFVYYLPKFGKNGNLLDLPVVRQVLNDWELSGTLAARSGSPTGFGWGYNQDNQNLSSRLTGIDGYNARVYVIGPWQLPKDQQDIHHQFKTNVFVPPTAPSTGRESGFNYWSNPPVFLSTPELAIMKNFTFSRDSRRYVQLRIETYNLLNHHDYTGRDMNINFYSPTDLRVYNYPNAVAEPLGLHGNGRTGFGSLINDAGPRTMQATLKIYF